MSENNVFPTTPETTDGIFGPIPHHPNWLYHCPTGNHPYEMDVKWTEDFMTPCPRCSKDSHKLSHERQFNKGADNAQN